MINGSPVKVGDTVYVLGFGGGLSVDYVHDDGSFDVKVRGNSRAHFSADGSSNGLRQVYWDNPIFIDPPKDVLVWRAFKKMAAAIWEVMQNPLISRRFKDESDTEVTFK